MKINSGCQSRNTFSKSPAQLAICDAQLLEDCIRVLFSRSNVDLALNSSVRLALSSAQKLPVGDPVRRWSDGERTDRGLGRARNLARMLSSPNWFPSDFGPAGFACADYLYVTAMAMRHRVSPSSLTQIYRLWYLCCQANHPPSKAISIFGDLKQLPTHQRLAAGARMSSLIEMQDQVETTELVLPDFRCSSQLVTR